MWKHQLRDLVNDYIDVFGNSYNDLAQTNLVKLHVDTGDAKPIVRKPDGYLSYAERIMLRAELKEMLDHGVIVPAKHMSNKDGPRSEG